VSALAATKPHRLRKQVHPVFFRVALVLAALAGGLSRAAAAEPLVVASVLPVQSLVAAVMDGVGTPGLIVHGAASPHAYALRPSEARQINGAQVVFWIGPEYESFLVKPVAALAGKARVVALLHVPAIETLPARTGGSWNKPAASRNPKSGDIDPHVFLDPLNAIVMVEAIATTLGDADPAHRDRYGTNAEREIAQLKALDLELQARLAPVRSAPFLVFHDGYQYLEHRYGLNAVGSLVVSPERPPGARRMSEIRGKIESLNAACIFAEPQFDASLVHTVAQGTKARTAVLDYVGVGIPPGPDAYFVMMRDLARSLVGCLSG
jgi:zinc transport system substrate-binding protein